LIELDTLVVAILSAFLGGLAATWLRIRHERDEAFRDRQINAADDFSTGLQQALLVLRDAYSTSVRHGFYDDERHLLTRDPSTDQVLARIAAALERAEKTIAEVHARHARIALLFGIYTPSTRAGGFALTELDTALDSLAGWPRPDLDRYHEYEHAANEDYRSFNERALADMRGRHWHRRRRLALWMRRRIERRRLIRKFRAEQADAEGVSEISNEE
jgi:hypothetical protein